jgi:hypothetical protein
MRISLVVFVGIIVGCGGAVVAETQPTYVGPSDYLNHDCPQLLGEARAVSARSASLAGVRDRDVGADGSRTSSAVIPWPKAFSIVVVDKTIADRLALMRGQMLAIEDASIRAQCSIQFPKPPA